MLFESVIRLGFFHSLMESHLPDSIPLDHLREKMIKDIKLENVEQFGFFDTAAPNFVTYYPEVKAEDLIPKDSDFVQPVVRSLSKVVVHRDWNPVDFSDGDVLKQSINLLYGQSIYPNHEAMVGNELGVIKENFWDEPYTKDGVKVPAGINSRLMIDGKSNPKVARGLMMNPPSIHSTSVTVRFLWEKSHPSMSEEEFFKNLATKDKDGVLIRRIASKVKNYSELSFVPHGADPFAQNTDKDGKIVNPKYATTVYNSMEKRKGQKWFTFDYRLDLDELKNNSENTIPTETNDETSNSDQNTETMNRTFLLALALTFGLKETELPTDDAKLQEMVDAKAKEIATTALKVTTLEAEKTNLETQLAEAKKNTGTPADYEVIKNFKTEAETNLRTEVKANYNKSTKEPNAVILAAIEKANYEGLIVMNDEYKGKAEQLYPLTCSDCHSKNVTRATSISNGEDDNDKNEPKEKGIEALKAKKLKASSLSIFTQPEEA